MKRISCLSLVVSIIILAADFAEVHAEPPAYLTELVKHDRAVNVLCFSPNGKLLATGCSTGTLKVTEVSGGNRVDIPKAHDEKVLGRHDQNATPPRGVLALAFSADGQTLFSGGADGFVYAWNLRDKSKQTLIDNQLVAAIALSPDGRYLASAGYNTICACWTCRPRMHND